MLTASPATWTVRGATFALWALAAASAVYWGLQLTGGRGSASVPATAQRQVAAADPVAIARVLGGTATASATAAAPQPTLASRLQLVGVAAGASSGQGAAVIAVDGKPARPYRVGSVIEEGLVLLAVRGRQATLAAQPNGPPILTLELPPFKR
ncbi:MAG TPA: type II secretion system protein N [Ramlibacter sp.]|jgi:general secretion pathway protein C|nr:type II secretion system protein N [Ramlibacter sp.]